MYFYLNTAMARMNFEFEANVVTTELQQPVVSEDEGHVFGMILKTKSQIQGKRL
jgi:hypothetical protein